MKRLLPITAGLTGVAIFGLILIGSVWYWLPRGISRFELTGDGLIIETTPSGRLADPYSDFVFYSIGSPQVVTAGLIVILALLVVFIALFSAVSLLCGKPSRPPAP